MAEFFLTKPKIKADYLSPICKLAHICKEKYLMKFFLGPTTWKHIG